MLYCFERVAAPPVPRDDHVPPVPREAMGSMVLDRGERGEGESVRQRSSTRAASHRITSSAWIITDCGI